jgi:hypothetical protein
MWASYGLRSSASPLAFGRSRMPRPMVHAFFDDDRQTPVEKRLLDDAAKAVHDAGLPRQQAPPPTSRERQAGRGAHMTSATSKLRAESENHEQQPPVGLIGSTGQAGHPQSPNRERNKNQNGSLSFLCIGEDRGIADRAQEVLYHCHRHAQHAAPRWRCAKKPGPATRFRCKML